MIHQRRNLIWLILLTILFIPGAAASAAEGPQKGLFIYWRGETECAKGFKDGLKQLGVEFSAKEFDAEQDKAKLEQFLASLDASDLDFIYTFGTTASVKTAEKVKATPIFFGIVTNPVKAGLIADWQSSGNNVTGVSHAVPYKDQADFIARLGALKKVGIIYNPNEKNSVIAKEELEPLLKGKGAELVEAPVSSESEIGKAVSALQEGSVDLVYLPSDSFIVSNQDNIIPALTAAKIATYGALEKFVREGGAMTGIVTSYYAVGQRLARNASEVLQKGKSPSEVESMTLPFSEQTVLVNGPTVEALGFDIPYEIVSMAEIIE